MTLNQIAQQAMDYLDSVGVAADYDLSEVAVKVSTETGVYLLFETIYTDPLSIIKSTYPQKSPA